MINKEALKLFLLEEDSPTMAEYGLLLILVALVSAGAVVFMGNSLRNLFQAAAPGIGNPSPPPQ